MILALGIAPKVEIMKIFPPIKSYPWKNPHLNRYFFPPIKLYPWKNHFKTPSELIPKQGITVKLNT